MVLQLGGKSSGCYLSTLSSSLLSPPFPLHLSPPPPRRDIKVVGRRPPPAWLSTSVTLHAGPSWLLSLAVTLRWLAVGLPLRDCRLRSRYTPGRLGFFPSTFYPIFFSTLSFSLSHTPCLFLSCLLFAWLLSWRLAWLCARFVFSCFYCSCLFFSYFVLSCIFLSCFVLSSLNLCFFPFTN
jgi:hypothetical protein